MSKLAEYLNRHIVGNVFDRATICEQYSRDRSILEYRPKLVAFPENADDVCHLMRFVHQLASRELTIPVTPRGTGLDKTGAAIGPGIVISTERMNQLEEIDIRGRLVRVQPGMTLGRLNAILSLQNLWLPVKADPDSTIGGLIANGATDPISEHYGGIEQAVDRIEIVLPSGDVILLAPYTRRQISAKIAENGPEGKLYSRLERLFDEQADTILDRSMRPHDLVGYSNVTHVHDDRALSLLPLIFGSQGTLGIITDIILRVELLPPRPRRLLASFHDLKAAEKFLTSVTELGPTELQVLDLRILDAAATAGKRSGLFTRRLGKGFLVLVSFTGSALSSRRAIKNCLKILPANVLRIEEKEDNAADFYEIDNLISCYLNGGFSGERGPLLDDIYLPAPNFTAFISRLAELEGALKIELPLWGSYLTSTYTVRPNYDVATIKGRQTLTEFIQLYSGLVGELGGSITGTAPEGRVKTLVPTRSIGVSERAVYTGIKDAFDPYGVMNPGVKFGARPRDILTHLRETPLSGIMR